MCAKESVLSMKKVDRGSLEKALSVVLQNLVKLPAFASLDLMMSWYWDSRHDDPGP